MAIVFIATYFFHQEYTAAVNEHIPGANHGAIGFPLHGHVIDDIGSEIRKNP